MSKIGFNKETNNDEQLLNHIKEDLKKDLQACEQFKNSLRKELKELDDLETHMLVLAEQADSVKKLMEKRRTLLKNLFTPN